MDLQFTTQPKNISVPEKFFKPFSSNRYLAGSREFLESNSIVAKFAFLILIFIVFIVLLRVGSTILSNIFSYSSNPVLINGMIDSKQMVRIPQNPNVSGAKPIMRSKNQKGGLEFTWSVWIIIDDMKYKEGEYKHVFHKGNDDINRTTGLNHPNNAPGLYIAPHKNDLVVIMNTFNKINEEIVVKDVPLNKWMNVMIRVDKQNKLDVYINGRLVRRHVLYSVPKQNYGDVFVSMNGGFSGHTSNLRYYAKALGTSEIQDVVNAGPNMNMVGSSILSSKPEYLSNRWFFRNA